MTQTHTSFDALLTTARDLAITVVTGQLGPPVAGRMWIGTHTLDTLLCPDQAARQVALLIAPGGPGWTHIRTGRRTLTAEDRIRLARDAAAAGGSVYEGRLAVLTPATWLTRHDGVPRDADPATSLPAATAAGWPANCGNDRVLFLDDQSICALLAQGNVGRTVTLLVGTIAEPEGAHDQEAVRATPGHAVQAQVDPIERAQPVHDGWGTPTGGAPAMLVRAIRQDEWEQPRSGIPPQPAERERAVGDRIAIRQGRRPLRELLGQVGTVVEVFRVPRDSCLVRIDGDPDRQREWFCYHDEVATSNA